MMRRKASDPLENGLGEAVRVVFVARSLEEFEWITEGRREGRKRGFFSDKDELRLELMSHVRRKKSSDSPPM